MSALPITLPNGVIAIYGPGINVSSSGVIATEKILFGSVDKVWDGGQVYVYGGDNVMFNEQDIITRLTYGSGTYTLVPARLVTKEQTPP